jgi:hypothetical protein
MSDDVAETARLMNVIEAIILELERQGLVEALWELKFDPTELARVAIRAADGQVIPFQKRR